MRPGNIFLIGLDFKISCCHFIGLIMLAVRKILPVVSSVAALTVFINSIKILYMSQGLLHVVTLPGAGFT